MRDGVLNLVPNVLTLQLLLNYVRNLAGAVTYPVRLWISLCHARWPNFRLENYEFVLCGVNQAPAT